jgi:hypothetical protein
MFNCIIDQPANTNTEFIINNTSSGFTSLTMDSFVYAINSAPFPINVFSVSGLQSALVISDSIIYHNTSPGGNCITVQNGGIVNLSAVLMGGFNIGLDVLNVGAAPNITVLGTSVMNSITDINISHPSTTGSINGSFDRNKVFINSFNVSVFFNDPVNGGITSIGEFNLGQDISSLTPTSTLIIDGSAMGVYFGGILSDGGGFAVNVAAGSGYSQNPINNASLKYTWTSTSITLTANSNNYIYFINTTNILSTSSSLPSLINNIVLGRVVTNGTGILFIDESPMFSHHFGNTDALFQREGLGAVYGTGSLVSDNASRNLEVGSGLYFFASNKFTPSGFVLGTSFNTVYRNNNGEFEFTYGTDTVVDNVNYNDLTIGPPYNLVAIPGTNYAKHSLYINGDGTNEKYFLVYAQTTDPSLVITEAANIPTPPDFFDDGMVLIANIIVRAGTATIIEIIDQRPVIGFKASGISATAIHGNLLGLAANDHPQYLLVNGNAPGMSGSLSMNNNQIVSAGLINGVTVELHGSRHLPNNADPITTAAPTTNLSTITTNSVGIQNSLARSDHLHTILTGIPITQIPAQTNAAGTSNNFSKADHIHNIPTAAAISLDSSSTNTEGTATTFARSDHTHAISSVSPVGSTLPNTDIWVGNGSNVAAAVGVTGDITLSNTGVVGVTKINGTTLGTTTSTAGNFLLGTTGSGSWVSTPLTGDISSVTGAGSVTLANTGVIATSYLNTNLTVDSKGRIVTASNGSSKILLTGIISSAFSASTGTPVYTDWGGKAVNGIGYILFGFSGTIVKITLSYIASSDITIAAGRSASFDVGHITGNTVGTTAFTAYTGGTGFAAWTSVLNATTPFTDTGAISIPILSTDRLALRVTELVGAITPTTSSIIVGIWILV